MAKDKNYVSFGFWLFAIVISWLPCIGFFFNLAFAFIGENETRKNYFKAQLLIQLLVIALLIGIHGFGFLTAILKFLSQTAEQWPEFLRGP